MRSHTIFQNILHTTRKRKIFSTSCVYLVAFRAHVYKRALAPWPLSCSRSRRGQQHVLAVPEPPRLLQARAPSIPDLRNDGHRRAAVFRAFRIFYLLFRVSPVRTRVLLFSISKASGRDSGGSHRPMDSTLLPRRFSDSPSEIRP